MQHIKHDNLAYMTIEFEIELDATQKQTWDAFTQLSSIPEWNLDVINAKKTKKQKDYEQVIELTYRTKRGEVTGYEYVVQKQAPTRYVATYNHPRSAVTCITENTFTKLEPKITLWQCKITYKPQWFNWFSVRLHRRIFAHAQRLSMIRFKNFVEETK